MTRLRSAAITTTPATSLRATASRIASSIADGWNCCAPAANGKAATLPQRVMNSRRFIGSSSLWHREGSLAEAERRYHAEAPRSTTRTHRATKKAGLHYLPARSAAIQWDDAHVGSSWLPRKRQR